MDSMCLVFAAVTNRENKICHLVPACRYNDNSIENNYF